jgi:hypothetical protein
MCDREEPIPEPVVRLAFCEYHPRNGRSEFRSVEEGHGTVGFQSYHPRRVGQMKIELPVVAPAPNLFRCHLLLS